MEKKTILKPATKEKHNRVRQTVHIVKPKMSFTVEKKTTGKKEYFYGEYRMEVEDEVKDIIEIDNIVSEEKPKKKRKNKADVVDIEENNEVTPDKDEQIG